MREGERRRPSLLGAGGIRFTASGPNAPGLTTELLLQRLPNERRKSGTQYKTLGFHTFTAESLSVDFPLEPGYYVPAYAFLEPTTGHTTAGVVLEMVEVGS